jgi:hypothetical protein
MNEEILQEAGLTKAEAKIYTILVKNSPCAPPRLADLAEESRTNTYKVLDSLEFKELVSRDETKKKLRYWANNPSIMLDHLKEKRREVEAAEKRFQGSLPNLIDQYFKHSAQPSIRYFNGVKGIEHMYQDQLDDGLPITFTMPIGIRTFYGTPEMHRIRNLFPARGIQRHVFYPDVPQDFQSHEATVPIAESDRLMKLTRTWLSPDDLQSPVEWAVYGDKLAIISLGVEVVGMIIESPQIVASFKEILDLLDRNIRAQPDYDKLPLRHIRTMIPESVKKND